MPPRAPPAVCPWPDCGREYATKRDLQRHQLSHGAPQFACNTPGCDRKFYRRDALLRHQRNKTCARRLARRDKGEEADEAEEPNSSAPDSHVENDAHTRRPQRTDSLESSSSSSRGYPITYRQAVPPLRVDSVHEGDYDEDEEDEDDFGPPLSRGPSSPIRSSQLGNYRYSGPYEPPSYQSQPRSPVSSRHSYNYSPSSYGPPPLRTSYYDTPSTYVSGTLHDHHIYGKTSNARGSIGGEDVEDDY